MTRTTCYMNYFKWNSLAVHNTKDLLMVICHFYIFDRPAKPFLHALINYFYRGISLRARLYIKSAGLLIDLIYSSIWNWYLIAFLNSAKFQNYHEK